MKNTPNKIPLPKENGSLSLIKAQINARLDELVNLEPGWDGYNGQPVSLENANFALEILKQVCLSPNAPVPQIVPGVNGDLQMEWHTHSVEIELHILAPHQVHAWIFNAKTYPDGQEFLLDTDFSAVAQQIKEITERFSDRTPAA